MTHNGPRLSGSDAVDPAADQLLKIYEERELANLVEASPQPATALGHQPGDQLGSYRLLQHLADGGMGEVWIAERSAPFRLKVALKIIKVGMDTREVVSRFEVERKALALMDHPHIARVFDGGATEQGRPYFVMELVEGLPITAYCDQARLSTRERLVLFIKVCEAVQHAHQRGIIHRDLKPGNILVATHDRQPFPKVIDFGVAKATNQQLTVRTLFTEYGRIVGTLAYMSPEQAEFNTDDVDTRADLYSLGCILYELLTGAPPFDEEQLRRMPFDQVCKTIRETDPAKPSTKLSTLGEKKLTALAVSHRTGPRRLRKALRGDLDRILVKALEKDRKRRYQTASDLALDVRRYLNQEPVSATAPDAFYRIHKFALKHRGAFAASAMVMLSLVLGLGISLRKYADEKRARLRAEAAEQHTATVADFLSDMIRGADPSVALGRDTSLLREILDRTSARLDTELTDQPAVEARLRNTIGQVYLALSEYELAEAMFRRALKLTRQAYGTEHGAIAHSLDNLANALRNQNRLEEAEVLANRSLRMRTKLFGPKHLGTARSLATLGNIFRAQARYPEAENMHLTSLALRRTLLGAEHADVAESLNDLGLVFHYGGKLDDALRSYRRALAIERKSHGPEHPAIATGLHNVAVVLAHQGKLENSEVAHRDALEMYKKMLGDDHPAIARPVQFFAEVLRAQRKQDALERLVHELIAQAEDTPGTEAVLALLPATILFEYYTSIGEVDSALSLQDWLMGRPTIFTYDESLAPLRIGVYLAHCGLDDQHEILCRKFLEYARKTNNPTVAERAAKLILIHPDPPDELVPVAAALAQRAVDQTPDYHCFTLWFQSTLGLARVRVGDFSGAKAPLERALASRNRETRSLAYAVRAMSEHHQEMYEDSRESLSLAEKELGELAFKSKPELETDNFNRIVACMLIREARELALPPVIGKGAD